MDNPRIFYRTYVHNTWRLTRGDKMCDQFEYSSVIGEHHVNKDIFMPTIRKTLQCQREPDNDYNNFAVAIIENDTIVGHVP